MNEGWPRVLRTAIGSGQEYRTTGESTEAFRRIRHTSSQSGLTDARGPVYVLLGYNHAPFYDDVASFTSEPLSHP